MKVSINDVTRYWGMELLYIVHQHLKAQIQSILTYRKGRAFLINKIRTGMSREENYLHLEIFIWNLI
ncbi:hypothetical protein J2Z40_001710 [Cytobacillus eiseniae]|uniref:Uncharacterized protein n=1 Tax=Cytobacillus eiseniae TaxID=762947 RepID=A0ABS4REJ1_9BACI|nr:hypothetical protein [Cytobacillus eiseniae]